MALLRFPPGVTLEDAGYDWAVVASCAEEPTLPLGVVARLRGLGVETVAAGSEAAFDAFRDTAAPLSSLDAFAEDYLRVNGRLGGERCVTIAEYAMHTRLSGGLLHDALRDWLPHRGDTRVYGDAAFRKGSLPDILRLRLWHIAEHELPSVTCAFVPCRIHGKWCGNYPGDEYYPRMALSAVLHTHLGARVAVQRRLLDGLRLARRNGDRHQVARAAREVARVILDALPEWAWVQEDPHRIVGGTDLLALVASAATETCQEYAMLIDTLRECKSVREAVRLARDPSLAVFRALEGMG